MKLNFFKIAAVLVFTILAVSTSFAQATVQATAITSANIVTPITISKSVDLVFGDVAVNHDLGGTVTMSTLSVRSVAGAGGVTLPSTITPFSAAKFTVNGEVGYTYNIQIPSSVIITRASGTETMTVDSFTSDPVAGTGAGLLTAGSQDIYVGATLNVTANQKSGLYTNATSCTVTVNYN